MGQQGYSQVDKLKGGEGWGGGEEAGRNQKRQMEQALKIKLVRKREWRENSQTPALQCAVPAVWVWSGRVCETDDRDGMGSRSDDLSDPRELKKKKKGERRDETNWGGGRGESGGTRVSFVPLVERKGEEGMIRRAQVGIRSSGSDVTE